jgi:ElaA protein
MEWILKTFDDLNPHELYAILQLRNEVFAIEQHCVYPDMDNKDQGSHHLMCWQEIAGSKKLVAYTRLLPPALAYPEASIGRVVTSAAVRGNGTGRILMQRSIELVQDLYHVKDIRIGAQLYLLQFYSSLGFVPVSEVYLEDGIEHIEMLFS